MGDRNDEKTRRKGSSSQSQAVDVLFLHFKFPIPRLLDWGLPREIVDDESRPLRAGLHNNEFD